MEPVWFGLVDIDNLSPASWCIIIIHSNFQHTWCTLLVVVCWMVLVAHGGAMLWFCVCCWYVGQGYSSELESEDDAEGPESGEEDEVGTIRRSEFISVLRMLCAMRKEGESAYVYKHVYMCTFCRGYEGYEMDADGYNWGGVFGFLGRELVFMT